MDHTATPHGQRSQPGQPSAEARLRSLCTDITILERQLALALKTLDDEDPRISATAPLMVARSIGDRLIEGCGLLRGRGGETAAAAAFRRYLDGADCAVHRLQRVSGPVDATLRQVRAAASLFLNAAQQRLAAVSHRHEPELGDGFDLPGEIAAPEPLARIA